MTRRARLRQSLFAIGADANPMANAAGGQAARLASYALTAAGLALLVAVIALTIALLG